MKTEPNNPSPDDPPKKRRVTLIKSRPKGKIAQLPPDVRLYTNELLQEGKTYRKIADALAGKNHPGISHSSICNWYHNGHQLWLKDNHRIQDSRFSAEAACNLVQKLKESGETNLPQVNDLMLASRVHEIMREFDPKTVQALLDEKPETFFRLAAVITGQAAESTRRQRADLDSQKYQDIRAEQRAKIEKATRQTKGGLSDESLRQIKEALHLL